MTEQTQAAATPTNAAADANATSGTPTQPAATTAPSGEATPASTETPAATAINDGEKPKEGDATTDPATQVPERYELAAPEGFTLEPETTAQFETIARDLKLTNEQANKLVPLAADLVRRNAEAQQAAHVEQVQMWLNESKADKEFGGDKFDQSIVVARNAVARFATPQFKELMDQTGLGNHPEMLRLFHRIGNAIAEDKFVNAPSAGGGKPSLSDRLYPNVRT